MTIFFVIKVQHQFAIPQPGRHRGNMFTYWIFGYAPHIQKPPDRQSQRNKTTGDGCTARSTVRLNHIAINGNCMFAQNFHINNTAQCAPNHAGYFRTAMVAGDCVARFAHTICAWQHGIFGRDPTTGFVLHTFPYRLIQIDTCGTDYNRSAHFNHTRTFGPFVDAGFHRHRTHLIIFSH